MEDEKLATQIIYELNRYAREYDSYDYGLPVHDFHMEEMIEIVTKILKK